MIAAAIVGIVIIMPAVIGIVPGSIIIIIAVAIPVIIIPIIQFIPAVPVPDLHSEIAVIIIFVIITIGAVIILVHSHIFFTLRSGRIIDIVRCLT